MLQTEERMDDIVTISPPTREGIIIHVAQATFPSTATKSSGVKVAEATDEKDLPLQHISLIAA